MQPPLDQSFAWEPITPSGIAAFANASFRRLLLVQSCVALLVALAVSWCLVSALFPLCREAIENLPERGAIRAGVLDWPAETPRILAANRFVSLAVNLHEGDSARTTSHLDLELGFESCRIALLAGAVRLPYPKGYDVAFNRPELEPMWGAWRPFLAAAVFVLWIAGLMFTWAVFATLYAGPLWLTAFFTNRELSLPGSWRVAGAALMPGALFMAGAILLYRFGWFNLTQFFSAVAVHLLLGWVCLVAVLFFFPRVSNASGRANPFATKRVEAKVSSPNREVH